MNEEKSIKTVVGIDISKDKYDVCLMEINIKFLSKVKGTRSFVNNAECFRDLTSWLSRKKVDSDLHVVMEATGSYYEQLAKYLYDEGFKVHVVLPNKAKHYLDSLGLKSKNDKIDAQGLALMGLQQHHELWEPMAKEYYEMRAITRQIASLQRHKVGLKNQVHALSLGMYHQEDLINQLNELVVTIETQIGVLEQKLCKVIQSDDYLSSQMERITKVKGLSTLSVATVIAETGGFKLFKNQRQLVSYAGYDVVENSSGKHVGKTKISKKGNSQIRRILHMPSLTTVRCKEPHFTGLYERVYARTGIKKKGYVAVQKKLLVLIYTLWKNEANYDTNHHKSIEILTEKDQKPLLSFDFKKVTKKVGGITPPTQDEPSHEISQKALLSLNQM